MYDREAREIETEIHPDILHINNKKSLLRSGGRLLFYSS
jgi:hypothetical protein